MKALERWSPPFFFSALSALLLVVFALDLERELLIPIASALGVVVLIAGIGVFRRRTHHFETLSIGTVLEGKIVSDLATVLGAGLTPRGSGTVGSIAALPFAFCMSRIEIPLRAAVLAGLTALSVFITSRYLRYEKRALDPKEVVIDEFVGVSIAIAFVPWDWLQVGAAFVLFRLLDIAKPGPIGWVERRFHGAAGVIFDDVLAGLIAGGMLLLVSSIFA